MITDYDDFNFLRRRTVRHRDPYRETYGQAVYVANFDYPIGKLSTDYRCEPGAGELVRVAGLAVRGRRLLGPRRHAAGANRLWVYADSFAVI